MRDRLRAARHRGHGLRPQPGRHRRRHASAALVEALPAAERIGLGHGAGRGRSPTPSSTSSPACSTAGDLVIDGGNSRFYQDDRQHAELLAEHGHRLPRLRRLRRRLGPGQRLRPDGRRRRGRVVERAMPVFDALRPEGPREEGFVHAGTVGAGHYAKMVHNGIEYGLMQAYAEGYELLAAKDLVTDVHGTLQGVDRAARSCGPGCSTCWSRRSRRTRAWSEIDGYVDDSGEGRWTVEEAIDQRRPDAGDLGGAVRPVRLPPGRLPRDEGRRGAAQPVRRPRGERRPATARRPPAHADDAGRRRAPARCTDRRGQRCTSPTSR